MPRIYVIEPVPFSGRSHSETCYHICAPWKGMGQDVTVHTTIKDRDDPFSVLRPLVPAKLPRSLKYRFVNLFGSSRLTTVLERKVVNKLRPGDICYFWPDTHHQAVQAARDAGAFVAIELINTHVGFAHGRINAELARAGLPPISPEITAAEIEKENLRIQAAHALFAPGPYVAPSVRKHSPSDIKILEASYGAKFPRTLSRRDRRGEKLRFIFVGIFGIRKGARTILQAWEKADLDAEFHIFGFLEDHFRSEVERLGPKGVRFRGYTREIADEYAQSDVFVFPSLEEGGPQVTYEAAGHALPLIVTKIGGGRIANEENALIVEDANADSLAAAMRKLASDATLRHSMGQAARRDAEAFDWQNVSEKRLRLLLDAASQM